MAVEKHNRLDMATRQLETALSLYFEGQDQFSVITLAGAADEIFGQVLRAQGQEPRLQELSKSVAAIYRKLYGSEITVKTVADRANHARNALKHWSEGQPLVVEFDVLEEAKDMVERGIANYWSLFGDLTPQMERFEKEVLRAA
ncbi:hypothetical protein H8N03_25825 [Ramlibacter sp. USB13]|uniref:Uncharacterized protein n=1 Tax=Ramlibacter cellulosilyticus TaxID=2764187 RepID=A0A923MW56_9BURK|nr:hypothetical protein [Ramlibacter cellulosilyticus]MBC5786383.1 hypothetical protein [Ramlibacter cellulosilyticus]